MVQQTKIVKMRTGARNAVDFQSLGAIKSLIRLLFA
jgi:hypothetical protein